jgi:uncharacterized FlaG/YvyC family protein
MNISSTGAPPISVPVETPQAPTVNDNQRSLIQAVKAVNGAELFGSRNELTFVFDRATNRTLVRIVDRETHEVVDQIPPESVLKMAEEIPGG